MSLTLIPASSAALVIASHGEQEFGLRRLAAFVILGLSNSDDRGLVLDVVVTHGGSSPLARYL